MTLLITRLLITGIISATLLANCTHAHGQLTAKVTAVMDVEAVLDSMADLQNALSKIDEERRKLDPSAIEESEKQNSELDRKEAKIRFEAYRSIRITASKIAALHGVNLITRMEGVSVSDEFEPDLDEVEKLTNNPIVYHDRLDLTRFVIVALEKQAAPNAKAQFNENKSRAQLTAVLDVERVLEEMDSFQKKLGELNVASAALDKLILSKIDDADEATNETLREKQQELSKREAKIRLEAYQKIEIQVAKIASQHGIALVVRGRMSGLADAERDNLARVNEAIKNPIVYHRRLDLTNIVIQDINKNPVSESGSAGLPDQDIMNHLPSSRKIFNFSISNR